MPIDGAGNYSRVYDWTTDRDNGVKIRADRVDGEMDDQATVFNLAFWRDGRTAMSGDLDMGDNLINSIGSGVVGAPAVSFQDDVDTGFYLIADGQLGITVGGTKRIEANTTGAAVTGNLSATGNADIDGTLTVDGNATLGDGTGDSHTLNGSATITGNVTMGRDAGSLSVTITAQSPLLTLKDSNTAGSAATGGISFVDSADSARFTISVGSAASTTTIGGGTTLRLNCANMQFPAITTTASAANAFLDSGNENRLARSTSSLAYKRNIEDVAPEYYNKVLSLRPVYYRSKVETDNPEWSWWGLIAEEVAAVDPRLVHYGYQTDQYEEVCVREAVPPVEAVLDDEGNEVSPALPGIEAVYEMHVREGEEKRPDGVQYERLAVLLLAVVKEQQEKIAALQAIVQP